MTRPNVSLMGNFVFCPFQLSRPMCLQVSSEESVFESVCHWVAQQGSSGQQVSSGQQGSSGQQDPSGQQVSSGQQGSRGQQDPSPPPAVCVALLRLVRFHTMDVVIAASSEP